MCSHWYYFFNMSVSVSARVSVEIEKEIYLSNGCYWFTKGHTSLRLAPVMLSIHYIVISWSCHRYRPSCTVTNSLPWQPQLCQCTHLILHQTLFSLWILLSTLCSVGGANKMPVHHSSQAGPPLCIQCGRQESAQPKWDDIAFYYDTK